MKALLVRAVAIAAALVAAPVLLAAVPTDSDASTAHGSTAKTATLAAVPGIAPKDAAGGTYLDEKGQVLPTAGSRAHPLSSCTPGSGRDNPHYTAPDVSGHGWWTKGNCSGSTATVYNCLYEYYTDATWRQKACSPKKSLKPGGGSAQRTNARVTCGSTGQLISWRNHVDVDVNGESDTAEEPYNQEQVYCVVG